MIVEISLVVQHQEWTGQVIRSDLASTVVEQLSNYEELMNVVVLKMIQGSENLVPL
jgi:hypothetical protein